MASEACKTIPPVVADGYAEKGKWIELGGLKTYVTGPSTSKRALIVIYDIFGPASQTLQGADGLSTALSATVYIPDLLTGTYAQPAWFTSPDPSAAKTAFYANVSDYPRHTAAFTSFLAQAQAAHPGVSSWGAVGLCWGGKVAALSSFKGTGLRASGQVHPGRLEARDAERMVVPHVCLASSGEDEEVVEEYRRILGERGVVEYYGTMHHGWMGARAKLHEAENVKEYERGYNQLAAFFDKHL